MTLYLLSPWTGTGATPDDAIRPAVLDAFALDGYEDVSGQAAAAGRLSARPSPNLAVVRIECRPAVAAQIAADPMWADRVIHHDGGARDPDAAPDTTERSRLRARLRSDGVTLAQAAAVVDALPANATRQQIVAKLVAWLRDRPQTVPADAPERTTP